MNYFVPNISSMYDICLLAWQKYHEPWFLPLVLVQALMLRVCDFGQSYQRSTGNIFLPTCAAGSEQGHMGKNIRQCIWREAASFLWSICQQLELPDFNLHHPLRWADWLCGCCSPLNRRGSQGGMPFNSCPNFFPSLADSHHHSYIPLPYFGFCSSIHRYSMQSKTCFFPSQTPSSKQYK